MAKRATLVRKIEEAKANVSRAEVELERVMGELEVAPRAEKKTMSQGLEVAFAMLRGAKATLTELETLLPPMPDSED